MARVSQYQNIASEKSDEIISKMSKLSLDIKDLENFQHRYGISNKKLSELSGHVESSITEWKSGKLEMPFRIQQHFSLLIAHFSQLAS